MMNEGDAVIKLKANRTIELVFAEDDETLIREVNWEQQEVYKTAVQFALMLDTFFKNGEGLDNLIMLAPSGNIAGELLGKEMLSITLAGVDDNGAVIADADSKTEEEAEEKVEVLDDNVVDASERFKKKDDNDGKK